MHNFIRMPMSISMFTFKCKCLVVTFECECESLVLHIQMYIKMHIQIKMFDGCIQMKMLCPGSEYPVDWYKISLPSASISYAYDETFGLANVRHLNVSFMVRI